MTVIFFSASAFALLVAMKHRLGFELADDGAFFLRYANNFAQGHFWVWNIGDAPIWGASAPLYPLFVALPISLGLSPRSAAVGVGFIISITALAGISVSLRHKFGSVAAISFVVFAALDSGMMYYPVSGLETPLTIALLAVAVWGLLSPAGPVTAGIIAAGLIVHKLDLIPIGVLFIVVYGVKTRRITRQLLAIAILIPTAWYGFAWIYFGSPLPNAFLTKALHQGGEPHSIDWTWFGNYVLLTGSHRWLFALSVIGVWRAIKTRSGLAMFLGGTAIVHLSAYTLKYPFEPYNWYAIPAMFSLILAAAMGVEALASAVRNLVGGWQWVSNQLVAAVIIAFVVLASANSERVATASIKRFVALQEHDRAEAGRWVSRNSPNTFSVLTAWGNPAFYSERKVLDGSFLNRKFENSDLVARYRPEIIIFQGNPGSSPAKPVFATNTDGYRIVKTFATSFENGLDYYFSVLARSDVIDRLTNVDSPRDLMAFVKETSLGDTFGAIRPQGSGALFVHPGATQPTRFFFNSPEYLVRHPRSAVSLDARMSPAIPEKAIRRGGGVVTLRVFLTGELLLDTTLDRRRPLHLEIPASRLTSPLEFVVDNHGSPDSDWLILSIR